MGKKSDDRPCNDCKSDNRFTVKTDLKTCHSTCKMFLKWIRKSKTR